jgi:hypothetical protein
MYSEKLIREVKACYPDYEKIHELANDDGLMECEIVKN